MMAPRSIGRADFIVRLRSRGLSYADANKAYEATVAVFADAVTQGHRVSIGHVGALVPKRVPPKTVHMGFRRSKGGKVEAAPSIYMMGERVRYKFSLFKNFMNRHGLNWVS